MMKTTRVTLGLVIAAAPVAFILSPMPQAAAQSKKAKKKLTAVGVFVVPIKGDKMSRARKATLLLTMETALKKDKRLNVIDKDIRLARRGGYVATEEIANARDLVKKGEANLAAGRPKDAVPQLNRAVKILAENLAYLGKRDLARAQFLLGASYAVADKASMGILSSNKIFNWRDAAWRRCSGQ